MISSLWSSICEKLYHFTLNKDMCNPYIWVRSWNCGCFVTWFCYQLIAKPGNKTAAVSWPDPYGFIRYMQIYISWSLLLMIPSVSGECNEHIIYEYMVSPYRVYSIKCPQGLIAVYVVSVPVLTHRPLEDLDVIIKKYYSIFLYCLVSSDLFIIMCSEEYHRTLLILSQHWFR